MIPSRFVLGAALAWLAITLALWALAFAPLPEPPVWLARARSVCFGTLPNGLPDTYGWVSLIMGPLSMLGFLLVAWSHEIVANVRWLASKAWGLAALGLYLAVPVAGLAWVGQRVVAAAEVQASFGGPPVSAEPLPAGYARGSDPAPGLTLVNQHGQTVSLDDFKGRPVLLTFAYAHCTTVCPVLIDSVRSAAGALRDVQPAVVVVTLDPWRDTPGSLPRLAESWRLAALPRAHLLSGAPHEVQAVLEAYEVLIQRIPNTGEIIHPGLVYVLDPQGRMAYTFNNAPVGWLVEAVWRVL